jgi:plastocyanin
VSVGLESNGIVPVYAGLNAGERVVTEGSFLLRAESLKLNPSQLTASAAQPSTRPTAQEAPVEPPDAKLARSSPARTQSVTVTLDEKGYQPDSFKLRQGVPARVTFVRKVESGCGTEIVLADYNIKRELPFNRAVTIEFTPTKTGEFKFACGMDMLRGKIIVQ